MRKQPSRRELLRMAAVAGGGIVAAREAAAAEADARKLGIPLGPYGERSPFEKATRWTRESKTPETGSSFTPIQNSVGTLTPSSLHYERHHSGIPTIDPGRHRLVIHGMVNRPLSLSMDEIRRLPSVTRTLVLECGGNSGGEWTAPGAADVQRSYGLVSCSEWTGVPLAALLADSRRAAGRDVGDCRRRGRVPHDAQHPDRESDGQQPARVRTERRSDPAVAGLSAAPHQPGMGRQHERQVAAQPAARRSAVHGPRRNGEVLRPDAGRQSPHLHVRHGSQVGDHVSFRRAHAAWPRHVRADGAGVVGPRPDRSCRGHDRRRRDTGSPRSCRSRGCPIALTRFRLPWRFEGREAIIASRAIDETGYVQPTREALVAVRGTNSIYHYNGIKFWKVRADGTVGNVEASSRGRLGAAFCRCRPAAGSRRCAGGAVAVARRWPPADARRDPRAGIGDRAGRQRPAAGIGIGRGRPRAVRRPVRAMPRTGRRRRCRPAPRRRTRHAAHAASAQDGRQLLAVRDDAVGLRQPGDAVRSTGPSDGARSVRGRGLRAESERHHRRRRRHGRDEPAKGEDAESRRVRRGSASGCRSRSKAAASP